MKTNFLTYNHFSNLSFNGTLPKGEYKDVRFIPNINCAKCNNRMLSIAELRQFYSKILISSDSFVKTKEFQKIENENVKNFFQNFAAQYPNTNLATSLSRPHIANMVAELSDEEKTIVLENIKNSDKLLKSSSIVVKHLKNLQKEFPHMSKYHKDLINLMDDYSKKYPDLSFSEIFKKPEIIEHHKKITSELALKFKKKLHKTIDTLEKLSKHLPKEAKSEFQELNERALRISKMPNVTSLVTKNLILLKEYENFLLKISDKKLAEKIKKELDKLPHNDLDVNFMIASLHEVEITDSKIAGIVKKELEKSENNSVIFNIIEQNMQTKEISDISIINKIVNPLTSTFEHVLPVSKGGLATKENGLFLCKTCNGQRKALSYSNMVELFADFSTNVNAQIKQIIALIKNGNLPEYLQKDTLIKLKENLLKESDGKLKVDISEYLNFKKETTESKIKEIQSKLGCNDEIPTKLETLQNKYERIEEKINELKKQKHILQMELRKLQKEERMQTKNHQPLLKSLEELEAQKAEIDAQIAADA